MFAGLMSTMSIGMCQHTLIGDPLNRQRTETAVADLQVPQIDPQIVRRDIRLLVRIHGYRVYVVCMGIGVNFARDSGNNIVLLLHSGQSKVGGSCRSWHWPGTVEVIGFCDYSQRLLEYLP